MSFIEKITEIAKSMGVGKDFAFYKKWALDHLKKQLKEEKTVTKALAWCENYMEKAYGVGTIRTWKGKRYIKGADKKWRRYYDKHERGTNLALSNTIKQLEKIDNMEDLAKFININRARFTNEFGQPMPEAQEILRLGKERGKGIKEGRNSKVDNKDPEGRSNQEENKRDKRIGNVVLWDGKLKRAIKSGDVEKIKSTMSDIEKEYNEAKNKLTGKELDFAETEYKFRKRDADKAISDLDKKDEKKTVSERVKDVKDGKSKSDYDDEKAYEEYQKLLMKDNPSKEETSRIGELVKEHYKHSKKEWIGGKGLKELKEANDENKILSNGKTVKETREKYGIKPEEKESEQEKHDNRSNAMKGNDNAKKDGISDDEIKKMTTFQLKKRLNELEDQKDNADYKKIQDELNKREKEEDAKDLQVNVDGIKNKLEGKSETEVKKYFNWLDKEFANKPENSIEKRAIKQAKADYYGDSGFVNTNIEKGIESVANKKKLDKYINDTTVESFASEDKNRGYGMTGVYNDPEGYKVATDGHMIFAEKADISEENAGKVTYSNGVTQEENYPKWKRVIPENAEKTNLFDDRQSLLKLCLLGNKLSKLNKKKPSYVKIGKFFFDTNFIGKCLAVAEKNDLNDVTIKENGTVLFKGPKGMAVTLPMINFNESIGYLDAESKMFYGQQSDAVKEFLGTDKDINNPKREEELKQIDKEESQKAEKYAKEVAEKNKEYEKYGMRLGRNKVNNDWVYTVDRKMGDDWEIGGHDVYMYKDSAERAAENLLDAKKRMEEYDKRENERKEREEKAKQERVEGYGEFLTGKDAKTKARIMQHLEKRVNWGNGKVMSYKEYIEDQFKNGDLAIDTHEENKLKGPSRRAYNRMNGRQQEEAERRIRDAGKKTVYEIKSKSKGGYYDLGKYAYDYAKYLLESGGVKKSFSERIEEIMNKSDPESGEKKKRDLNYYKQWALSVLDKYKGSQEKEDGPNEDTIVKALAYVELLTKSALPVGTVRDWKGVKYVKIAPDKWKPKVENPNRGAKMDIQAIQGAITKCESEKQLFDIIRNHATPFRAPNGEPLPEVQELHDIANSQGDNTNTAETHQEEKQQPAENPPENVAENKPEELPETGKEENTEQKEKPKKDKKKKKKKEKDPHRWSKRIDSINRTMQRIDQKIDMLGSANVNGVIDSTTTERNNKTVENVRKREDKAIAKQRLKEQNKR